MPGVISNVVMTVWVSVLVAIVGMASSVVHLQPTLVWADPAEVFAQTGPDDTPHKKSGEKYKQL
ncbi:hypothetical protein MACH17_08780 [Phaeobacter inhibens]|nr:hypothetical protein MACH17_08780 [Phaeobacter inhibens]